MAPGRIYDRFMDLGHGARWRIDACSVCPAQTLPAGKFDVADRPSPATRYDPTAGHRINTTTGLPECVHPGRVRMPVGRYISNGEPLLTCTPRTLEPPEPVTDLESWLAAIQPQVPAEQTRTADQ